MSGLATTGRVCTAKPAAATTDAESIAETAARRYKAGEFALAAQLYDRAWELAHRPALLFNAARSWEKAGQMATAIARYDAYVQVETDAGGREEARLRATALRDQLRASAAPAAPQAQPAVPPPAEPAAKPSQGPSAPAVAVATPPAPRAESAPSAVATPRAATPSRSVAPWLLVGTGVALLAGGGAALAWAGSGDATLQQQVDQRNTAGWVTGTTQRAAFERAEQTGSQRTAGAVLVGVGAVATVAGGLWAALRPAPPQSSAWVGPTAGGFAFGAGF